MLPYLLCTYLNIKLSYLFVKYTKIAKLGNQWNSLIIILTIMTKTRPITIKKMETEINLYLVVEDIEIQTEIKSLWNINYNLK
ncbi:hypothetical protein LCGC14_1621680 [marine sediment metagenome]|uniref:Uncharacterized protein n=1 Tax=marine sediment metagenome TaxID=412755 RepID=A0A0F9KKU9_9ZZZZ